MDLSVLSFVEVVEIQPPVMTVELQILRARRREREREEKKVTLCFTRMMTIRTIPRVEIKLLSNGTKCRERERERDL